MEFQENIGQNIKAERVRQKKELKEVATHFQLTPQAWGNIENGKTDFGISRLFEISDFFKISFQQLLMIDKSNIYNIHVENNSGVAYLQNAEVFNNMDIDELKKLIEFIETLKRKK